MYFTAQSCLHVVINFDGHLNPTKMYHICPLATSQYWSTTFCGNEQILWLSL